MTPRLRLKGGRSSAALMASGGSELDRRVRSVTPIPNRRGVSSFHQLAPYIGKMPPIMARRLLRRYSQEGETVLDPFCGSGTVPFEAAALGRHAIAIDLNPYAVALTKAKLAAPPTLAVALDRAERRLGEAEELSSAVALDEVPEWVRAFFHPETLRNTIALFDVLIRRREHFLIGCLLGILHHQRAGFLSYPASHLTPYLRTNKFPRDHYPELYEARAVRPRLLAKIRRVFSVPPELPFQTRTTVRLGKAQGAACGAAPVDLVLTSPPYMNDLDYGRDNRLRLWFLGRGEHRPLDAGVRTQGRFMDLMDASFKQLKKALKPGGHCVLVVGESRRSRSPVAVPRLLAELAVESVGGFRRVSQRNDVFAGIKRTTVPRPPRKEWIIVLRRE